MNPCAISVGDRNFATRGRIVREDGDTAVVEVVGAGGGFARRITLRKKHRIMPSPASLEKRHTIIKVGGRAFSTHGKVDGDGARTAVVTLEGVSPGESTVQMTLAK